MGSGRCAGGNLSQFQAICAPAKATREQIEDLEDQLTAALATRDAADAAAVAKVELVVNGVRADPTEGPDSALYEAMGYTRKSGRKSGLTQRKHPRPLNRDRVNNFSSC